MYDDIEHLLAEYRATYPPLLTFKQAAEIAQLPVGTIYDWSSRGHFDDFKRQCGRERRLIRDRFVRFLLEGSAISAAA